MVGVERDAGAIAFRDLLVFEGTAEALPTELTPDSFDGVVFSHVMEHLVDPVRALRSAAALLKSEGTLFCEVPNNESTSARVSGLSWEHLDVPRHLNFFTERSLQALAKRAGMKVKRSYFTGYCRLFNDSYIGTEQRIHDKLPRPEGSTRNSQARAWHLLVKTVGAKPQRKYDSVGIVLGR